MDKNMTLEELTKAAKTISLYLHSDHIESLEVLEQVNKHLETLNLTTRERDRVRIVLNRQL